MNEQKSAGPAPARRVRFLVIFALSFLLLQRLYLLTREQSREVISQRGNAVVSARLINTLTPGENVVARGGALYAPGVRLEIYKGCEGIEVMIILAAALLAFPLAWPRRVGGIAAGLALLYLVNQVRIVSLYYILTRQPALFDLAHGTLWQTAMILVAGAFFVVWVQRATGIRFLHRPA